MFHDYLEYKCININKLAERVGITRRRLGHHTAPYNLTYVEVAKLKDFIGDWDTYKIQEKEEN